MIPDRVLIWTTRGYQHVGELTVGDKVISYNPERACMEYDKVEYLETGWQSRGLIGIQHSYGSFLLTPDHPIPIINPYTRELQYEKIDDLFMSQTGKYKRVLTNKLFEPGTRRYSTDDIEWIARLAVSSSRFKMAPLYWDTIQEVVQDITGIEAREFLTTFFHWNILRSKPLYLKTCLLRNESIKAMLYHVAPRAGVGTFFGSLKTKAAYYKWVQGFSIAREGDLNITRQNWCADRHEGIFYNLATKNGNFLAKFGSSTIPIACNSI